MARNALSPKLLKDPGCLEIQPRIQQTHCRTILHNKKRHPRGYLSTLAIYTYTTFTMSTEEDRVRKQLEAGERESARLWRAWRTVHEMVQDRGYELSEEEVKISLQDFKNKYTGDDGTIRYEGICALQTKRQAKLT